MTRTPQEERRQRHLEKLQKELGPAIIEALGNPDVIEVHVFDNGEIQLDRMSVGREWLSTVMPEWQRESVIGTVASWHGLEVNRSHPTLRAELPPDGARFQGMVRPVEACGFVIRRPFNRILPLTQFVSDGSMTVAQMLALQEAVANRQKILIGGATLSGKTILANSLVEEALRQHGHDQRTILIEDTYEMTAPAGARAFRHLHTSDQEDLRALIRETMRLSPDLLVVGEMRGPEALEVLKAWMSGHGTSVSTLHAATCEETLWKFESYIEEAKVVPNSRWIGAAVNLVVAMERVGSKHWRVKEMMKCEGWDGKHYQLTAVNPYQEVSHEAFVSTHNSYPRVDRGDPGNGLGGDHRGRVAVG